MMRKAHIIGLCVLFSALYGCATERVVTEYVPREVPVYETVEVPPALLEPCPAPSLELETNQDLETALADALLSLQRCNDDKAAIGELE